MPLKLVLKPTSGEMDVRLISGIHGWQLLRETLAEASVPRQLVWAAEDGTLITYVEDALLQQPYLVISGPQEENVEQRLRKGLEIYTISEIVQAPISDLGPGEAQRLVNAAASLAPETFDVQFHDFLARSLRHPSVETRRAAVFAITYVPWKQLRDLLLTIQNQDPEIARDIEVVIQSIDAHGWR